MYTPVDPADFPGTVTEYGFQTPSGNITCGIGDDTAVCQIDEFTYTPPKGDCGDSGWGFNFRVAPGEKAELFCAGDVESGGPTLDYNQQLVVGDVSCLSAKTGVTCINVATGNGFRIAKAEYVLFSPDDAANGQTQPGNKTTPSAGGKTGSAAGFPAALTGSWYGHGRGVNISADGHGALEYRTYRFCSDDPTPPCDAIEGSSIISGGHIAFALDTPAGDTAATGTVTESNDPQTAVGTPLTATVRDDGYHLDLSIWPDTPFCSADGPDEKWDCGA